MRGPSGSGALGSCLWGNPAMYVVEYFIWLSVGEVVFGLWMVLMLRMMVSWLMTELGGVDSGGVVEDGGFAESVGLRLVVHVVDGLLSVL